MRMFKGCHKLLTKPMLYTSRTKKVKKLERLWANMSLIYTLPGFLGGLKSGLFINYAKALRMIRPLKTKWLT